MTAQSEVRTLLHDIANGVLLELHGGVAVLTYDQPDSPVNTLNSRMAPVFDRVFDLVSHDDGISALVLRSDKPDSWIAGADIGELSTVRSAEQGEALSRGGQRLLDRLAALPKPTVAAMHGAVLGGGLETALACTHRIGTDHPKTLFAFPEVQLGLIPGAGGTQRLPERIGLKAALDMMLTGRNVRAKRAIASGLIDELVHPSQLMEIAIERAMQLARGEPLDLPSRKSSTSLARNATTSLLEDNAFGRKLVFRQAREQVLKKSRGHYPAPLAVIDAVQKGYAEGAAAGMTEEARQFGALSVHPVTRQLVYLFFATTALKKSVQLPDREPGSVAMIRKVGILGAGFMGSSIATVAVQAGSLVRLKDATLDRFSGAFRSVRDVLRERVRRKQITRAAMQHTLSLLSGTSDYRGFSNVDLVIEAVFEDLAVKHQVLRDIEQVSPRAIFASNTSTIPIHEIASEAVAPDRVVGMHFFSPVPKMPLLEVIVTPETSADTASTVVHYGRTLGKTVIVVRDGPGFYVNRMVAPYLNECGRMVDAGAAIDEVDAAMVAFGFPVGPFTLLDEVGLDIAAKSGPIMAAAFGDRMQRSLTMARVIESGRLGRKAKRGFYTYDAAGKRGTVDEAIYLLSPGGSARRTFTRDQIQQRASYAMLNEAARCLEEGVIQSARDGDVGAVFGIGFPPFLGGPFRYLDSIGIARFVEQLDALDVSYPGIFSPSPMLRHMAATHATFHDD